jgi:hypothetical protein
MTLRGNKLLSAGFICLPCVLRAETIFWAENLTLFRLAVLPKTLFTLVKGISGTHTESAEMLRAG